MSQQNSEQIKALQVILAKTKDEKLKQEITKKLEILKANKPIKK